MATSPKLSPPEIAPNEADLNEITRDDTAELTTSAPLNSSSVPVADMVGHPLTSPCWQWEWLNAVLKSQVRDNYKPSEDHESLVTLNGCVESCQQCQILSHFYRGFNGSGSEAVIVTWLSIEETSFLRFEQRAFSKHCATLSAIGSTPNPWGLHGLLPSAESTGSSACMRLLRRWLDDCINNHPSCRSPDDPVLPTRVLDLGLDSSTRVSLWEPRGRTGRYACLSYCWGKSEFTVTTRGNLRKHLERGIELKDLPQTFRDAVEVTRALKVRYLWIDALCIIQKEADHEDWKRECGNMASIYHNSYVTIAAAWANSANSGCFITPDPGVTSGPVRMRDIYHSPFKPISDDLTNFPIFTRAWTFQERLLARRVIYFGRQEIVWDCITKRACECGGVADWWQSLTKLDFHNRAASKGISGLWRRLIEQYSPLQLTCPNDKLPALSGLAQAMTTRSQGSYLAGLWKDTLLFDMCWTAGSPKANEPLQARWRAPSWSWASIDGPINYPSGLCYGEPKESEKGYALVREAKCTPAGPSLTGQVKDGFVTLDGFLIPASFKFGGIYANCSELESLRLEWFPDRAYELEEMRVIYLIPMLTTLSMFWDFQGLVVKPYGQGTEMTRVGLARRKVERHQLDFSFFDCAKQVVKIV